MRSFTTLTAKAAPLRIINVDTDMIIPKQFLKTIKRTGLGSALFYELKADINGNPINDFVLNRPEFANSQILIAGENFGCGSSREHAPWALIDYGFSVIIAPSFADIFYNNCFKNGILPVVLPRDEVEKLMQYAEENPTQKITVDLPAQVVTAGSLGEFKFSVDTFRKHCLMNGLDDIGLTMEKSEHITAFEANQKQQLGWLY